ncbi:MAG: NAD(P)-dependent oxidoreductase [Parvularcula sp.]
MAKIAFLGMGEMGRRMASRLVKANHEVCVWNRTQSKLAPLLAEGATTAATPALAAEGAEFVLSMVRDDAASQNVWAGDEGALRGLSKGAVAAELSTLSVEQAKRVGEMVPNTGAHFVDAPLAGSLPQADAGQLIFFAGGDQQVIERLCPVLLAMGGAVHSVGSMGAGAAFKLMVNALFGAQVAVLAEVLSLGEAFGIPRAEASQVLGSTPVLSDAARGAAASMVANAYAPMFPIGLVAKDFSYIEEAAKTGGITLPVSQSVAALFEAASRAGYDNLNITGIKAYCDR